MFCPDCTRLVTNGPPQTVTTVARPSLSYVLYASAGGNTLLPEHGTLDVLTWLDWEETTLREAVLAQDVEGIHHAVQHLQSALGSNAFVVGGTLTLADVIIYVALLPVQVRKNPV